MLNGLYLSFRIEFFFEIHGRVSDKLDILFNGFDIFQYGTIVRLFLCIGMLEGAIE
jgi:hypothetical protein